MWGLHPLSAYPTARMAFLGVFSLDSVYNVLTSASYCSAVAVAEMLALMALSLHAAGFTMPSVDFDTRRLILVHASAPAATIAHVAAEHCDDLRYVMTSSETEAINLADAIAVVVEPKRIGKLPISKTPGLREASDDESVDEVAERVLEVRDFVLSGTAFGYASLLVARQPVLQLLLAHGLGVEPSKACGVELPTDAVCVIDFGPGTFPASVADELPVVRDQWINA